MGAKADVLCAVRADADVLLQWVDADYLGQLTQLMPFLPAEVRPAGIHFWEETCNHLYGLPAAISPCTVGLLEIERV